MSELGMPGSVFAFHYQPLLSVIADPGIQQVMAESLRLSYWVLVSGQSQANCNKHLGVNHKMRAVNLFTSQIKTFLESLLWCIYAYSHKHKLSPQLLLWWFLLRKRTGVLEKDFPFVTHVCIPFECFIVCMYSLTSLEI